MTDKETIQNLEGLKIAVPVLTEVADKAISALQERIDREKGCEYCNNTVLPSEGIPHEFLILENAIYYYDGSKRGWEGTVIEHCPWCGRALKEG